jgi:hypothetical protein
MRQPSSQDVARRERIPSALHPNKSSNAMVITAKAQTMAKVDQGTVSLARLCHLP